jgi:hypothetical protein
MKKQNHVLIGKQWAVGATKSNSVSSNDLIVYGVFSKNIGDPSWYTKLMSRVRAKRDANTGYLDYLKAVSRVEIGDLVNGEKLLYRSVNQNSYAIEPYLLLVNLLGRNLNTRERDILNLVKKAKNDFDPDRYETGYNLVSLYYRVGALYLQNRQYKKANYFFNASLDELSISQKLLGDKQLEGSIKIGVANSLHGLNRVKEADALFLEVTQATKSSRQINFIRNQYVGTH